MGKKIVEMFKNGTLGLLLTFCQIKLQAQDDSLAKLIPSDDPLQRILNSTSGDLEKNGVKKIIKCISYHATTANATVIWKEDNKIKGTNFLYRYSVKKTKKKKINITTQDYPLLDLLFSNNCSLKVIAGAKGEKISQDPIFYVEKDIDGFSEHVYFWFSDYFGLKIGLCLQAYNKLFQFRNDWYY